MKMKNNIFQIWNAVNYQIQQKMLMAVFVLLVGVTEIIMEFYALDVNLDLPCQVQDNAFNAVQIICIM